MAFHCSLILCHQLWLVFPLYFYRIAVWPFLLLYFLSRFDSLRVVFPVILERILRIKYLFPFIVIVNGSTMSNARFSNGLLVYR